MILPLLAFVLHCFFIRIGNFFFFLSLIIFSNISYSSVLNGRGDGYLINWGVMELLKFHKRLDILKMLFYMVMISPRGNFSLKLQNDRPLQFSKGVL